MIQSIIIVCQNQQKGYKYAISQAAKILNLKGGNYKHPDLIVTTSSLSIGIEQIKDIVTKMKRYPYQASYLVAVIHPGELMTQQAQNALLKLLEEPPYYARFYITTTHISRILPTIRSRCVINYLNKPMKKNNKGDFLRVIKDSKIPIHQKMETLESLTKGWDIEEIKSFLDSLLIALSPLKHRRLFKKVILAKEMLLKNVHPQHVLDYICI